MTQRGPATVARAKRLCNSCSQLPVFKKGVRLNFTDFHQFSSKIASFQIRSAPQFHQFSSKIAHFQIRNFVRNGQISNKERGVPCRSGRAVSPIRFFDPILNNALALRASQKCAVLFGVNSGPMPKCHHKICGALTLNFSVNAKIVKVRQRIWSVSFSISRPRPK